MMEKPTVADIFQSNQTVSSESLLSTSYVRPWVLDLSYRTQQRQGNLSLCASQAVSTQGVGAGSYIS